MKKSKYLLFLIVALIIILSIEYLIDDIVLPGMDIFAKTLNIITWIIIYFLLILPWISIKKFKITIKSKKTTIVGLFTYKAIETTDKDTFLNINDIIPWKRKSNDLQKRLQIGKTYIIKTYRPWVFRKQRNILSATEIKTRHKK